MRTPTSIADSHDVPRTQLALAASFGLSAHQHRLGCRQRLHIAPGADASGQLEELTEADPPPADRDPLRHGPERYREAGARHSATSALLRRFTGSTNHQRKRTSS